MEILLNLLKWSLIAGTVTLLASLLKPLLDKRFSPRWRYWLWLVLAVALLLAPVRWESLLPSLPEPAVRVEVPEVRVPVSRPAEKPAAGPAITPDGGSDTDANSPDTTPGSLPETAPVTPPLIQPVTPQTPAQEPATVTETETERTIELSAILTALWLTGAAAFLLWQVLATARLNRQLRRWSVPVGAEVQELYEETCAELGVSRVPVLGVSRNLASPMAVGLLRPRLWLPDGDCDPRELAFILRHELTHIKRRDLHYKALMVLANALHWFDPLVWLMRREAGETVELLCDAQALRGADGVTRRAYCETLLANIRRERGAALTTYFYGGARSVKNRFKNLLAAPRRFGWTALTACVLAVALVACAVGVGGETDPSEETQGQPTHPDPADEPGIVLSEVLTKAYGRIVQVGDWRAPLGLAEEELNGLMRELESMSWRLSSRTGAVQGEVWALMSGDERFGLRLGEGNLVELVYEGEPRLYELTAGELETLRERLYELAQDAAVYGISHRLVVDWDGLLVETIRDYILTLPEWVSWKPESIELTDWHPKDVYMETQYVFSLSFEVKVPAGNEEAEEFWSMGAGTGWSAYPDEERPGCYLWNWKVVATANDSYWLLNGVLHDGEVLGMPGYSEYKGVEGTTYIGDASIEELLHLFAVTVGYGYTHKNLIPQCLCEKSMEELDELPKALNILDNDQLINLLVSVEQYIAQNRKAYTSTDLKIVTIITEKRSARKQGW